ncbi:GNAT family N-acetyltransferase [Nocardia crassostreae]|uniref:GNAT family N-acetyltransferase n=1 Tax=Nocardia crassostreae TaxID=53428 RepID=UPI00082FAFA6|nr:GNAT family N-acetyltransferase [Nocardia crassostreae]
MPELIAPTVDLHTAWLAAHREWGPGMHEDGFGLRATDRVDDPAEFAAWVARLVEDSDPARLVCTYRWIVDGDRVLGGIALRHGFGDFVRHAGHIGYGIRPSARRRGLATWALGRMLDEARALGMVEVLIVCEDVNTASAKTIKRHGDVLEGVRDSEYGVVRRYWISLGDHTQSADIMST